MKGQIPVFHIEAETLPEAWEQAVLKTWQDGHSIPTEYDKAGDKMSRDCTMVMVIKSPLKEPRIHRAFPGSLEDLEIYKQEVVDGVHDHWINPDEGKWTYTYHKRIFNYEIEGKQIDQINYCLEKLSQAPYSRRAQAITWNPNLDIQTYDPPCLQRLWFRLSQADDGMFYLNFNTHWRSRDAFKASFMNMFALIELQVKLAGQLSQRTGKSVRVGRYVDISDSFHIYGSYFEEFKRFLETIQNRTFEQKTWTTKFAHPFFEEAKEKLKKEMEADK